MSEQDIFGADVIGADAEIFGATMPEQGGGPYVTIHVKDVGALVRAKGGALGGMISGIVPKTIESKVYGDMASKIAAGMKAEGVDAEVKVVSTRPFGGPFQRDFLIGAGVGVGAVGVVFGIIRIVRHFAGRK